jgi:hypothetical protein
LSTKKRKTNIIAEFIKGFLLVPFTATVCAILTLLAISVSGGEESYPGLASITNSQQAVFYNRGVLNLHTSISEVSTIK